MQARLTWIMKRIAPPVAGLSAMFAWHYWKWDGLFCVVVGSTAVVLLFALIVRKGWRMHGDRDSG